MRASRTTGIFAPAIAGLALLLVAAAGAAPLRSPWDDHPVTATDAPYACPPIVHLSPDLTTDGFYSDSKSSIIDPAKWKAYSETSGPYKNLGQVIVDAADAWRSTGSRAAAACAVSHIETAARDGVFTGKMSSHQAYYVQGWVIGAIAVGWLKVRDSGLETPALHDLVAPWMVSVTRQTVDFYDSSHALNNHLYWAGVEAAAAGVAANDSKLFDWAVAGYRAGIAQIQPDGSMPLEMARGQRALHYHLFALSQSRSRVDPRPGRLPQLYVPGRIAARRQSQRRSIEREAIEMTPKVPSRTSVNPSRDPYRLQCLDRALAVLEYIGESDVPLSLADICRSMNLHKSTAHRALMVLERGMLLERTPDDRFRLGLKLYTLGNRAVEQVDLRSQIQPSLRSLSQRLGETVHLGVLQRTSVVYLDKAGPATRVCKGSKTGSSNPAYCTAMGKAMLAWLPQTQVHDLVDQMTFVRLTHKTIGSREELMQALERVRRRGYSIDDEEAELGARCIGAPIFDQDHNPIAALSVSCASSRIQPHQVPALAEHLRRTCSEISASLRMHRDLRARVIGSLAPERN